MPATTPPRRRFCATCRKPVPPARDGKRGFVYCTACRAETKRLIARENMQRRRAVLSATVIATDSWWMAKSRDALSAEAAARAQAMSNSREGRLIRTETLL